MIVTATAIEISRPLSWPWLIRPANKRKSSIKMTISQISAISAFLKKTNKLMRRRKSYAKKTMKLQLLKQKLSTFKVLQ